MAAFVSEIRVLFSAKKRLESRHAAE
jgi:hypothetical protein